MAATYSISAASGELMIPENAGVVLQAKSGINAIRVSGTATTTAGMTGPGTTANQIQFYSNDTIVGAFDRLGLYSYGITALSSLNAISSVLYPVNITRTGAGSQYGVGIDFKLTSAGSGNTFSYNKLMGGWLKDATEGTKGYFAIDPVNNSNFPSDTGPNYSLIYGDWTTGVTLNNTLNVTSILANNLTCRVNADVSISSYNASSNFTNNIVFQCKSSNGVAMGKTIAFITSAGFAMNSARSDGDATVISINTQPDSNGGYTMLINNGFTGATSSTCLRLSNTLAGSGVPAIQCQAGPAIGTGVPIQHISFSYNGSMAGTITQSSQNIYYNTSSDLRLKENLDYNFNAINILNQLKPVQFNFKNQTEIQYGFIAQEVLQILPDYVSISGKEGYYQMDYSKFSGILCKGLKEQQTEISELKLQLALLKSIVDNLKK
jgi:hypothetical protein